MRLTEKRRLESESPRLVRRFEQSTSKTGIAAPHRRSEASRVKERDRHRRAHALLARDHAATDCWRIQAHFALGKLGETDLQTSLSESRRAGFRRAFAILVT